MVICHALFPFRNRLWPKMIAPEVVAAGSRCARCGRPARPGRAADELAELTGSHEPSRAIGPLACRAGSSRIFVDKATGKNMGQPELGKALGLPS